MLLAGEAGVGKSALLTAAVAGSTGRATALGYCPGEAETPPYGPWREALRAYAKAAGRSLDALPPPFGAAAGPGSTYDLALDVADCLAAGPPALEDVHWADPASLDLLRHMTPHLRAAGDRALRLGATAQASAYYERALAGAD